MGLGGARGPSVHGFSGGSQHVGLNLGPTWRFMGTIVTIVTML